MTIVLIEILIPELNAYQAGFPNHWANILLLGNRLQNYKGHAMVTAYVRLVEAAYVHYRMGRKNVYKLWNDHSRIGVRQHNLSITYFEDCISSVHRATICMKRIRSYQTVPDDLKALLVAKPDFTKDPASKKIRHIRDAIQHMDDKVIKGEIPENTPFMLTATGPEIPLDDPSQPGQTVKKIDRLVIGSEEIFFSDLANWLEEMGRCAETISQYRRPPSRI